MVKKFSKCNLCGEEAYTNGNEKTAQYRLKHLHTGHLAEYDKLKDAEKAIRMVRGEILKEYGDRIQPLIDQCFWFNDGKYNISMVDHIACSLMFSGKFWKLKEEVRND